MLMKSIAQPISLPEFSSALFSTWKRGSVAAKNGTILGMSSELIMKLDISS